VPKTIVAPPTDRAAANGTPASDQAPPHGHDLLPPSPPACAGASSAPTASRSRARRSKALAQLHRAGSRFRPIGSLPTSHKGGFSFNAPPGASRTLRFG
jgi:hypothetical protein